ncbi:hypothetical protein CLV92_107121 [Kineococcus xinjiangensis]|uniref:Uncharacterized protein n=1 Tax=Kineococcus xinjiangensis TaxID=512762 RepID=A0A2S6IK92_9ACTN|nr:hypothetical protein [Kineococcus xinjiangensis]PPK94618.1 hypothetical protein CLV92_107121 [Kineococcus xinjiangensis]
MDGERDGTDGDGTGDDGTSAEGPGDVLLGIVAAPGTPADLATRLQADVTADLQRELPAARWRVEVLSDGLVTPPADDSEVVAAARQRMLAHDWDLTVCLTDLPLQVARRPVVAHASPVHGVAVVSVPALGAVGLRARVRQTLVAQVRTLLGADPEDPADATGGRLHRRLRELSDDDEAGGDGVSYTARVLSGNLRLLAGMVRANRPWRLAAGLSRALAAAVATGVFALITPDVWRLADAFGPLRHTGVAVASVAGIACTLVVGAELWERSSSPRARKQVVLFNLATTATIVIGVATLYAALFVLSLLAAAVLVVPALLAGELGHGVALGDYLELALLTSSLATVGGALGAGLESDEAVRQAAYSHRAGGTAQP